MKHRIIIFGFIFLLFMTICHTITFRSNESYGNISVALGSSGYEVVSLASGLNQPSFVTVDSNYVFFSELGASAIKKVPLYGGSVSTITSGLVGPRRIALDSYYVYFVDVQYPGQGYIKRVSKNGGSVAVLANNIGWPFGLTVDEQYVYFTDQSGGTVKKVPKTGGSVITLATGLNGPRDITVDANYVYFSDYGSATGTGSIKKISKTGGTVVTLASGLTAPYYIAIDENYVYFAEYEGSYIKKVPKNGGPVAVVATSTNHCYTLEVDEENVYFTELIIQNYQIIGGNVKKVPKTGGSVETIIENQNYPLGIAKDIDFLYYCEVNAGVVKKTSKGGDLIIQSIEPIQVIKNAKALIVNKKTVIQVNITSTFKSRVWIHIKAIYDFGYKSYIEIGPYSNGTPIDPGKNMIYIPGGPAFPGHSKAWGLQDHFYWWESGLDDKIKVSIDFGNKVPESISNNNELSISKKVVESRTLEIWVVPVYFPEEGQHAYTPLLDNQSDFIRAIYPIADPNLLIWVSGPRAFNGRPTQASDINVWLYENVARVLSREAQLYGYDRVIIVIPNMTQPWAGDAPGMVREPWNQIPIFVVNEYLTKQNYYQLIAHEMGHTFWLWHPHDLGPPNFDAERYWVANREYNRTDKMATFMSYRHLQPPRGPGYDAWIDKGRFDEDPLVLMRGLVYLPGDPLIPELPSGYKLLPISLYRWNLFDQLTIDEGTQSVVQNTFLTQKQVDGAILISGTIYINNTAFFDNFYTIPNEGGILNSETQGNYYVYLLDAQEKELWHAGFNVSFGYFDMEILEFKQQNSSSFIFRVPSIEGLSIIELRNSTGHALVRKVISENSPLINVLYPNGGEVLEVGKTYAISWEGYDADGDQLSYSVAYSPDNGETWIPIAFEINQTSITWDTSTLEGGNQYLIKVVVTDGVNTAWDISDSAFSVRKIKGRVLIAFTPYSNIIDHAWSFPNGTTFTLRSWLRDKGYEVYADHEVFNNESITLDQLVNFDTIILADWATQQYPPEVFADYANIGGGLIFLGQCQPADMGLSDILGFKWFVAPNGWGSTYVDAYITNVTHPIMQGITELPKAGGVFVDWDSLISETPLPPNTTILARTYYDPMTDTSDVIALIAFQFGYGRVVAGPCDGLIRPYGPTAVDPWDVIGEPIVENKLLLNCIGWVSGGKGGCDIRILDVSFSNPNPKVNETLDIYIKLKNAGMTTVTFELSLNYTLLIDPLIGTQTLTLSPRETITLNFTWIPHATGRYEIKAYTSLIPNDINPNDNIKIVHIYVSVTYISSSSTDQNELENINARNGRLRYMAYTL
ncbi:MAG: hypothetical protein QXX41_11035 [Nitrososphaerota archaeon]